MIHVLNVLYIHRCIITISVTEYGFETIRISVSLNMYSDTNLFLQYSPVLSYLCLIPHVCSCFPSYKIAQNKDYLKMEIITLSKIMHLLLTLMQLLIYLR